MVKPISAQEQRNLEDWLEASIERRRLIERQVELINGMLVSQGDFLKALEENAAAITSS